MRLLAVLALLLASACTSDVTIEDGDADAHEDDGEHDILLRNPDVPDRWLFAAGSTVGQVARTACSTAGVRPLSEQLLAEVECLRPGTMARIDNIANVSLGTGALPRMNAAAASALRAAVSGGGTLSISSSTRATAQQYVLYYWYQNGRCTSVVSLAAQPGRSNHESGVALDVPAYSTWKARLTARGFSWFGSGDPVHFDYRGTGAVDIRPLAVKSFQRLWNRNNPGDRISEDGVWGPATASRMDRAPAGGFAIGPQCNAPPPPPNPPPPPPSTATGSLIGVIYRGTDASARLPGATVRLSTGQTTTSDAGGVYRFAAVAEGSVTITASASGFLTRSITRTIARSAENWGSVGLSQGSALETECGAVTAAGSCDGDLVNYCHAGELITVDCAAHGTTCGWNAAEEYNDCL